MENRNYIVSYYVNDRLIGRIEEYAVRTNNNKPGVLKHTSYFCHTCGEVWAQKLLSSTPWPVRNFHLEAVTCLPCGDGKLLSEYERQHCSTVLRLYPKQVLAREFLLLMDEQRL